MLRVFLPLELIALVALIAARAITFGIAPKVTKGPIHNDPCHHTGSSRPGVVAGHRSYSFFKFVTFQLRGESGAAHEGLCGGKGFLDFAAAQA